MASSANIASLVASEVKKQVQPVEALIKSLHRPASQAGISPVDMINRMTAGGNVPAIINPDGTIMPIGIRPSRQKGVGMGDYLRAIAKKAKSDLPGVSPEKAENTIRKYYDPKVTKAALAESTGTTGGYTVPPQFVNQLMQLSVEDSIVRERATIMPMTSLTMQVPALDQTTVQSSGTTPFLGGISATWTAEAATRAETEPTFRQIELKAHELSFYTVASNNLLADNAVGLDSLLTQLFSQAIAWYTDYAYLQGNGVGKPLGILNSSATITVNRATSSQFSFADACGMLAKLYRLIATGESVAWVMSPSVIPQLLQMKDAGNNLVFIPVLQAGAREAIPQPKGPMSFGTLFGIPVIISEKLPALGTRGDVMLCDFSKYLLGDRMELQIDVSPHVKFLTNQMVWRVIWRGDGQPWLNNYITLADASTTVSAFVALGNQA